MAEPTEGYAEGVHVFPEETITAKAPEPAIQFDVEQEARVKENAARVLELRQARASWDKKTEAEQALAGEKEWSIYGENNPLSEYYTPEELGDTDFINSRWAELGVMQPPGEIQKRDPTMEWMHGRLVQEGLHGDKPLFSAMEEFYNSKDPRGVRDRAARISIVRDSLDYEMQGILELEAQMGPGSARKEAFQHAMRRALFKSWSMLNQSSTALLGKGRASVRHFFEDDWEEKLLRGKKGDRLAPKYSPQKFGHSSHPLMRALRLDDAYLEQWSKYDSDTPQGKHFAYMARYKEDVYRELRGEEGLRVLARQENGEIMIDGKKVPVWKHFDYPSKESFESHVKDVGALVVGNKVKEMYNQGVASVNVMTTEIAVVNRSLAAAEANVKVTRFADVERLLLAQNDAYNRIVKQIGVGFVGTAVLDQATRLALEDSNIEATAENKRGLISAAASNKFPDKIKNRLIDGIAEQIAVISGERKQANHRDMAVIILNTISGRVKMPGGRSVPVADALTKYTLPFDATKLMHMATLFAYRKGMEHDHMLANFVRNFDHSSPNDMARLRTNAHRNINAARMVVANVLKDYAQSYSSTTSEGAEMKISPADIPELIMAGMDKHVKGYGSLYMQHHFENGDIFSPKAPIMKDYMPMNPDTLFRRRGK